MELFWQAKFERIGFHPVEHRSINLVEQINQTWTYLAALEAARVLLNEHPSAGAMHLAPGAHASQELDIMSEVRGEVGAEVFAAVHESGFGTQRPCRQSPDMSAVEGRPAVSSLCRDLSF